MWAMGVQPGPVPTPGGGGGLQLPLIWDMLHSDVRLGLWLPAGCSCSEQNRHPAEGQGHRSSGIQPRLTPPTVTVQGARLPQGLQ